MSNPTKVNLNKTIAIDDTLYDVNAVHADEADKVVNKLHIKTYGLNNSTDDVRIRQHTSFDGTAVPPNGINFVDATTGGGFAGPITVPEIDGLADPAKLTRDRFKYRNHVLNYSDIVKVITAKEGAGYFTWGNQTFSWGDHTFEGLQSNGEPARAGIVIGKEPEVVDFAEENFVKKYLPHYLYITSDTHAIFYGTARDKMAAQLTGAGSTDVADKANTLWWTDGNHTLSFDATDIDTFRNGLSYLQKEFEDFKVSDGAGVIGLQAGLENGTIVPAKADEAVSDKNGNDIYWSYYRTAPFDSELPGMLSVAGENIITISSSAPAPGAGRVGDIWIQYSN